MPAGMIADTDPKAGSRITAGSTITIYPSTGVPPAGGPGGPGGPGTGNPNPTFTFPTGGPTKTRKPR
jgi:hypothetical protein